jgi:hypothetical protein
VARTWPQAAGALPRAASDFDWQGDTPLRLPMEDLVIYEMHVRGFTQHESSGVSSPGGFCRPLSGLGCSVWEARFAHRSDNVQLRLSIEDVLEVMIAAITRPQSPVALGRLSG